MNALQIFLLINAFLVGVVITLAVQYWLAHRNSKNQPSQKQPMQALPPAAKERLVKQAEENFQGMVNRSSLQLQRNLSTTSEQLNKLLEKFGSEVLDDEIKLFRQNVADIRANTQGALSGAQDEISKQQAAILASLASRQADIDSKLSARQTELETQLETSLSDEKNRLHELMQQKLNDAVLAFLLETLGHDVDLGAQTDYLLKTLEANKQQLLDGAAQ